MSRHVGLVRCGNPSASTIESRPTWVNATPWTAHQMPKFPPRPVESENLPKTSPHPSITSRPHPRDPAPHHVILGSHGLPELRLRGRALTGRRPATSNAPRDPEKTNLDRRTGNHPTFQSLKLRRTRAGTQASHDPLTPTAPEIAPARTATPCSPSAGSPSTTAPPAPRRSPPSSPKSAPAPHTAHPATG